MSQRDTLRQLDSQLVGAFMDVGFADAATFASKDAAPGAPAVPCHVLVDRDVQVFGDDVAEVSAPKTLVTFFLAQVSVPVRGSIVTLTETGETFKLDEQIKRDESQSRWAVSHV